MVSALGLFLGREQFPEGFPGILGGDLTLAGPATYWSKKVDPEYYFLAESFALQYPQSDSGTPSVPAIEIFRAVGERAYQSGRRGVSRIDLRNLASPGDCPKTDAGPTGEAQTGTRLKAAIPKPILFYPGTMIMLCFSGYNVLPNRLSFALYGRYIYDAEGGL